MIPARLFKSLYACRGQSEKCQSLCPQVYGGGEMAVIIEVLGWGGKSQAHYRVEGPSITIGRGYQNDVVLVTVISPPTICDWMRLRVAGSSPICRASMASR